MTKKTKILVLGGLVVLLGIVYVLVMPPQKALTTRIVLAPTGGAGTCGVPGNVGTIHGKFRDTVVFEVINNCGTKHWVSVKNFREKLDNGQYGPVTDNVLTGSRQTEAGPGQQSEIRGTVDTLGKPRTTYKYDIFIGTSGDPGSWSNAKDPDYDIWP